MCNKCKEEKPSSEFSRTKASKDGFNWKCRACHQAYGIEYRMRMTPEQKEARKKSGRRWRDRNPDKVLAASRAYYKENHEKARQLNRDWYARNKEYRYAVTLMRNYGISLEDYQALVNRCGGCCQICGRKSAFANNTARLVVDHCHSTGKIRGLLCSLCNRAIGQLGDVAESLMKAVEYLKRSETLS